MRVLLVKMSSLGDVVHTLPAVTDAAAHGVRFDWVVEEAFADVAARHPAVADVFPVGWRRWRRSLATSRHELGAFVARLRQRNYDLVLDAQGLIKSGLVAALARGSDKAGFSSDSAREGAAAAFYEHRYRIPRRHHAVDRLRALFAAAMGYAIPDGLDFGIAGAGAATSTCVLLHGTTWDSKHYPEGMWVDVCASATAAGLQVAIPWGNDEERRRAERVAAAADADAVVWPRSGLAELMDRLTQAALVVGVDSGLTHLSAALGVPTVVIYGSTDGSLTGCRGRSVVNLQAAFPCAPCLQRSCGYDGEEQHWRGAAVRPACYGRLPPDTVWQAATEILYAHRASSG
jgi:heptosyltransferase-1